MTKKSGRTGGTPARSAADWEDAALQSIATEGLRALSIPRLARSLGVTKGSFYWHFRSLGALFDASLRRWEGMDRDALEALRRIENPRKRLTALFVQSMESHQAHALYLALAGSYAPKVSAVLRRIVERRLQFLIESYQELGLDVSEAVEQALLTYAAYVGAIHLRYQRLGTLIEEKDLAAFLAQAEKILIPAARSRKRKP